VDCLHTKEAIWGLDKFKANKVCKRFRVKKLAREKNLGTT
jgi:hypothetical protein